MRILFTFAGGAGHAEPLVPVADAVRSAGHSVAFAGDERFLPALRDRGFSTFTVDRSAAVPPSRLALVTPDQLHEERVIQRHYAGAVARHRLAPYAELCRRWQSDVVVRDEADFAAAVVAERLGIGRAVVLVLATGGLVRPDVVAGPLSALRGEVGLGPDPTLAALYADLVLSPFLPSFRDPDFPLPTRPHHYRPPPSEQPRPSWWNELGDRPIVYLTLGTVFPLESGDLFERALEGLRQLPVAVVATVGPDLDPGDLPAQPEHVRLHRWLPQDALLPHVSLVVSHGGSGTVAAALRAGLPQLVLGLGADQLVNARRVAQLGLGWSLDPVTATATQIGKAAAELLHDPQVRSAATRCRAEAAALPPVDSVVDLLERLSPRSRPAAAHRSSPKGS